MNMEEMWTALEQYQPYADEDGYGELWRQMTTERTAAAAKAVAWAAVLRDSPDAASVEAWAAAASAWDAASAEGAATAERYAARAIEYINQAMKEVI